MILMIILILIIPMAMTADDSERLELCEKLLYRANEQIKADKEELARLYVMLQAVIADNTMFQLENDNLIKEISRHKGLYVGANITLPIGGNAILMYKFNKLGVYAIGGYNYHTNIGLGLLYKLP